MAASSALQMFLDILTFMQNWTQKTTKNKNKEFFQIFISSSRHAWLTLSRLPFFYLSFLFAEAVFLTVLLHFTWCKKTEAVLLLTSFRNREMHRLFSCFGFNSKVECTFSLLNLFVKLCYWLIIITFWFVVIQTSNEREKNRFAANVGQLL